jgi:hypothetical protein
VATRRPDRTHRYQDRRASPGRRLVADTSRNASAATAGSPPTPNAGPPADMDMDIDIDMDMDMDMGRSSG